MFKNQKLTFLGLCRDFWPLLTFLNLMTNFFEKFLSRASFWGIICLLLGKSQNLSKNGQNLAGNDKNGQKWPFLTKKFFFLFFLKIKKNEKFCATLQVFRYFSLFLRAKTNLGLCEAITRPRGPLKKVRLQKKILLS